MAEGRTQGAGDTKEAKFQAIDLTKALQQIKPIQAENFTTNNYKAIQSNQINFRTVAGNLRINQQTHNQTKGTVSKGAFPTFRPETQEEEDATESQLQTQPESSKSSKESKKKKKSKEKRKREDTTSTTSNSNRKEYRACLGPYNLSECFYVIKNKALSRWYPNHSLSRCVEERIAQDIALSEEIKRLTRGRVSGRANTPTLNNS